MNLFENDNITVTKIHHIEKYINTNCAGATAEYGTLFYSHEFVFFISGENDTTVGGVKIHDCPNSIRFMPKGRAEGRYTVNRLTNYSACIDIYFDTDSPMPKRPLGLYDNGQIRDKILKLADVWQKKEVGFYADSMKIFYDIISVMQKGRYGYLPNSQKQYMKKAHDYIIRHYTDTHFNYKELCFYTGLEYAYFSELFKKTYHTSPVKFVTKMRIDYSKELLVSGRYSVSEIAELCGFENVYYFSSVFKKLTGFPPSKYPMKI